MKEAEEILQALNEPSEFTKENRDFIHDANRDFQAGTVKGSCVEDIEAINKALAELEQYVRALRELGKACDIIDLQTEKIAAGVKVGRLEALKWVKENIPMGYESIKILYKEIEELEK